MGTVCRYVFSAAIVALAFSNTTVAQDVFVDIKDKTQITGQILEATHIEVATSFGKVSIPVDKLSAIKLHAGKEGAAVFAFKNGDLLTGTPDLKTLHIKTAWGKAHIDSSNIETIRMDRSAVFVKDVQNGWRVTTAQPNNARRSQ